MASRRVRDLGDGLEPVTDAGIQEAIDRQAIRIRRRALWVGAAAAMAAMLVP
jgi:hypothetical protein